mgnify:CR=1 FL=1
MSLRAHLLSLNPTHLLMLDGTLQDEPGVASPSPTGQLSTNNFDWANFPVCLGCTQSFQSRAIADVTSRQDATRLLRRRDINNASDGSDSSAYDYASGTRSMIMWFRATVIDSPTLLYEQGGGTNNFAFVLGLAKAITFQAADAGEDFLLAQSAFLAVPSRRYFICGIWEHHSQHSGSGNRVLFYVNGVLQEIVEVASTAAFPSHSGGIALGNGAEDLKTFNEETTGFSVRRKQINVFGMFNNQSLSESVLRDIFERSTRAQITIDADTVANQQLALDALIGTANTDFIDTNCYIRIIQATDATDYRLILDNITFVQDPLLRDIAISYIGPNVLTLENANGSNAAEVSAPAELDVDGTTIIPGGGSIVISENIVRTQVPGTITGTADKLVITEPGVYQLDGTNMPVVENYSSGLVTIELQNGATVPTTIASPNPVVVVPEPFTLAIEDILPGSSILIADTSKAVLSFVTGFAGGAYSYVAPIGYVGQLYYVISLEGYSKVSGSVTVSGIASTLTASQLLQTDTDGSPMYGGGITSANLTFTYSAPRITAELIGNITARVFYDEFQLFLLTEEGCTWLIDNADITRLTAGGGRQMIVYNQGLNASNASLSGTYIIEAEVVSNEVPFDVSLMGSVQFSGVIGATPAIQFG